MDFDLRSSLLSGCFELCPLIRSDARGCFVKTFHSAAFAEAGLCTDFCEDYYSVSHQGVLRGMHFQTPPHEHTKLVYCIAGRVMDVVVDLRCGSPTYGRHAVFDLDAHKANMVYLSAGLAHGFLVLSASAVLVYKVSSFYAPQHDAGILWSSVGVDWPVAEPIVSQRDHSFPTLQDYQSPFVSQGEKLV